MPPAQDALSSEAAPTKTPVPSETSTTGLRSAFSTSQNPQALRSNDSDSSRLCNQWVERGLTTNKAIQFLLQHLHDLGCAPPNGFISCRHCDKPQASGFGKVVPTIPQNSNDETNTNCATVSRDFQSALDASTSSSSPPLKLEPEIFVCQQHMMNETMTHKTIVHELIHAIDLCRTNMDPVRNCLHLACTEIRAENLSGECSFLKELPRMVFGSTQHDEFDEGDEEKRGGRGFRGHGGACIQRRAVLSVRANPKCAPRANEYVRAALPRCLNDNYPFPRHPNQMYWLGEKE